MVALDVAPSMLARARRRLAGQPNVALVAADMRRSLFHDVFDLVVAADDPFSHLSEDAERQAALDAAAAALRPGGTFVLDALWLSPPDWARTAAPRGRISRDTVALRGRMLRVWQRWRWLGAARYQAEYRYDVPGAVTSAATFTARAWTADEIEERLERAGLAEIGRWGDYHRSPWDSRISAHLLLEASRVAHPLRDMPR